MSRLLFFLFLIANLAFGAHLWLTSESGSQDFSARERNRDEMRIVAVTPPLLAARRAEESRLTMQRLAGAACIEFAGISGADLPKAREAFEALKLGDRAIERRVEEITRHWVFMPPARDRKTAEATAAQLKKQGVDEVSIRADHAVSLGVYATEEAARRRLVAVEGRGVKGAQTGGFSRELREIAILVREPDTELVARLALLQRDFAGANLRAITCPAAIDGKPAISEK